ncbi:metal-dependent hydrolase [Imhoffiella purpurea]|uniref:Membrane-bound metal-dependent hydrolase n=1 Tax=Imhoffiella purpurea TaxID=1249627 RepID=W9VIV0_9GAMM|nr:metal-dependent hydrolase [Imhoffiella purpurea]EXJ16926.1 hypothetical protein D779_1749 [Imhoffiella purpurea]
MLTPTHLLFAQSAYLTTCVVAAHPPAPEEAAVALLGATLPDLDSRASYIGRILRLTSDLIERYFGHRSFTHSLLVQLIAGGLAVWLLPDGYGLALMAGWVSHSWADMMTPGGVSWFWPSRIRCVLPGNPDFRMELGKGGEMGFMLVMTLLGVVMMPLAATGKGTTGLLRGALGDMEMVRREYDQYQGGYLFSVQITGKDNRTSADISGTYSVQGPWRDAGLILDTPDGPRSLCPSSACQWYSAHAGLNRGEPIKTSTVSVSAGLLAVSELRERVSELTQAGEVFLLGTAQAEGVKAQPPTLEVTTDTLTFAYAAPAILEPFQGRTLRNADLTIQVRHSPDIALPAASRAPIQARNEDIPALLERWLK